MASKSSTRFIANITSNVASSLAKHRQTNATTCFRVSESYPDQQRTYFTLRDARHTLATVAEGSGLEGSIYAGLESLTNELLGREWQRDDGAAMKIGRCLIDANWGHSTNVVYQFCRQSPHASILLPSHGRFVGASSNPFSEYKRRPGDRVGLNWRVPTIHGKRAIRHVIYDTNWWKSFTHARLAVAMGDRGCLSIFGDRPDQHRMFAEQVTAEYSRTHRRPRSYRRRMEGPSGTTRQPLARLPRRMRRRRFHAGCNTLWYRPCCPS